MAWDDNFAILVACSPRSVSPISTLWCLPANPGFRPLCLLPESLCSCFSHLLGPDRSSQTVIGVNWTWPAFNFGMLVGMVMFVSILVFYAVFCRGASAIAAMPTRMRDFLDDFGIITPPMFIVMAGWSFVHQLGGRRILLALVCVRAIATRDVTAARLPARRCVLHAPPHHSGEQLC